MIYDRLLHREAWRVQRRAAALGELQALSEREWSLMTEFPISDSDLGNGLLYHLRAMVGWARRMPPLAGTPGADMRRAVLLGILDCDYQSRADLEAALDEAFPAADREENVR